MEKIASLIAVRERSIIETHERLGKSGFTPEEADDAVATALRVGLINEERYTRAFIRGKAHSGWGKQKIIQRLHASGVDDETIRLCEDEFSSPDQEYEQAKNEIAKRPARSNDPYATYMRRLIGKGYSRDIATRVVKDFLAEQD
jgi:regulatory protein